jgi:rhamnosyl/mannosyltransferase
MIKVLQVGKYYPPYRGGMETHLADLCQQMKGRVELDVVVAHGSNDSKKKTLREEVDGIEVTRLASPWHILGNPVNPELVEKIQRAEADIVHLHWPNPLALLAYQLSGTKAKLVVTYQSDIIRQKLTGSLLKPLLDRAFRRATIIATSPNYLASSPVLRQFEKNCHIIPLGIDPHRMQGADDRKVRELKQRFGENYILATGRHVYYKGFQYLVEAMKGVQGQLVLAGDGPLRLELENQAQQLGVADRVHFVGSVSDGDLKALYTACGVFAFPSVARSEAFGLVQLEAMSLGKPVVNTWLESGVPFVSLHEQTGLTVKPCDPAELGQALQTILSDSDLRAKQGDAARRRVYEEFTLEQMGNRVFRLYEAVMGGPSAPVAAHQAA